MFTFSSNQLDQEHINLWMGHQSPHCTTVSDQSSKKSTKIQSTKQLRQNQRIQDSKMHSKNEEARSREILIPSIRQIAQAFKSPTKVAVRASGFVDPIKIRIRVRFHWRNWHEQLSCPNLRRREPRPSERNLSLITEIWSCWEFHRERDEGI